MTQDKIYMAVDKQSFNHSRNFNNFIDLDEIDTNDYNNFDKLHSLDDQQYSKIPLYPHDHANSYNSSNNYRNSSNNLISTMTSANSSINNISKKNNAGSTTKNDIFDAPITLVRPAPRISAKEIENLQKQEKLREEKDKKEKVKARKEIGLKIINELKDDTTKLYLAWDSLKPTDYNQFFEGNNNFKSNSNSNSNPNSITMNRLSSNNTNDSSDQFILKSNKDNKKECNTILNNNNSYVSSPEVSPSLLNFSPNDYKKEELNNHYQIKLDKKRESNNAINEKLNSNKLELKKLHIKNNHSPTISPKSSKILSPEEQIARFLNMPFISSHSKSSNGKSQLSPSSSINSFKSVDRLKTKSSFHGLSPSFSFSYQMDQESIAKLQKVWNKLYQKFVEVIPNINLSYLPTRKNLIGRGQYSNVYLGLYSVNEDEKVEGAQKNGNDNSSYNEENLNENNVPGISHDYDITDDDSPLKQCAVKCFHKDYVSQMVAMTELNILTMLKNQPYIIQLIGIINETEENKVISRVEDNHLSINGGLATPISNDGKEDDTEPIRVTTILEYASNGNILSWIKKNPEYVGKKLWIKWARQITHAVATFHNMLIIHHDIKPQNILLDEYLNAKIADFGSSCYAPDEFPDCDDLTIENCRFPMEMGLGRGTQAYCAPELFGSLESYTFATDIYSLGVTLIVMMTGNEPFKNARNNIHMIMCIRKGFFGSGAHDRELRFLNGEIAEPKIVDLLTSCVELDPMKRPTVEKILETLMEIDDYVPLEEKL